MFFTDVKRSTQVPNPIREKREHIGMPENLISPSTGSYLSFTYCFHSGQDIMSRFP